MSNQLIHVGCTLLRQSDIATLQATPVGGSNSKRYKIVALMRDGTKATIAFNVAIQKKNAILHHFANVLNGEYDLDDRENFDFGDDSESIEISNPRAVTVHGNTTQQAATAEHGSHEREK